MPYEVFLAFRYLRSRHKRRLARATSIAAILGISMGVAALIVAFALSNVGSPGTELEFAL